jgi:hypothetical protein
VQLSVASVSDAGTEDIKGVAFDLNTPLPTGLRITDITRTFQNSNTNTFTPEANIALNNVRSNCNGDNIPVGCKEPGFLSGNAGGGCDNTTTNAFNNGTCTDVPYDACE